MALASRFAVAKFTGGTAVRRPVTTVKPAAAPATASTPLGPQAVAAPSVLPPDANYDATIANSQAGHDINAADLARQRQGAFLSYGYTQDAAGNLAFDPTNPFSQSALLKRQYDQAQRGNTNSYAARGQLYSGALTSAKAGNELGYQQTTDALQKALTRLLVGIARGEGAARTDYETGVAQARGQRMPTT